MDHGIRMKEQEMMSQSRSNHTQTISIYIDNLKIQFNVTFILLTTCQKDVFWAEAPHSKNNS